MWFITTLVESGPYRRILCLLVLHCTFLCDFFWFRLISRRVHSNLPNFFSTDLCRSRRHWLGDCLLQLFTCQPQSSINFYDLALPCFGHWVYCRRPDSFASWNVKFFPSRKAHSAQPDTSLHCKTTDMG